MNRSLKRGLIYVAGALVTVLLIAFGVAMLAFEATPPAGLFVLMGLASFMGGLIVVSSGFKYKIQAAALLALVGVYYFAKANGSIDGAWMLRLGGLASLLAAVLMFYITFMTSPPKQNDRPEGDRLVN